MASSTSVRPLPSHPAPVSLTWLDVTYTVLDRVSKQSLDIVSTCSGTVSGGQMMALMGPSGSGKTSLLNVLARRVRDSTSVRGAVQVCGREVSKKDFRRLTAYVEQEDALLGSLTVRETVSFAVALVAPCVDRSTRSAAVERALRSLGLWEQRDTIVGTPLKKGISGGQKRRVSVATQLVTNPRVLFLDEPTSGLDSTASHEVVSSLLRVARRSGAAIIASIHQPSTATFELFDLCIFMAKGRMVYQGPVAEVCDYFESIGRPVPSHMNPSEHALSVTNTDFVQTASSLELAGSDAHSTADLEGAEAGGAAGRAAAPPAGMDAKAALDELVNLWNASPFKTRLDATVAASAHACACESVLAKGSTSLPGTPLKGRDGDKDARSVAGSAAGGSKTAALETCAEEGAVVAGGGPEFVAEGTISFEDPETISPARCSYVSMLRIKHLLHRNLIKAVRDPLAYTVRLAMYMALGVLIATAFCTTPSGQDGIQPVLNSLFFSSAFLSFMCVAYVPSYLEDLAVYRREHANGIGTPASFMIANSLVGLPFLFITGLVYTLIIYWSIPYRSGGFGKFLLYIFLDLVAGESLTIAIGTIVPIFVVALALTAFTNGLWMVVGGFLVPLNMLNQFWKYGFSYIDFQRWCFFGFVRNEVGYLDYECATVPGIDGAPDTCNCLAVTSLADQCLVSGQEYIETQIGINGTQGLYIGVIIAIILAMRLISWALLWWRF